MKAIQTTGLTKFYGKSIGIENLNLEVEEGDFFGFIGPNGAGKSTTIRTLLGLIHKTGGSASVLGMDIEKNHKEILSQTGYLPSEAVFYPGMRVRDLLAFSAALYKKDCKASAKTLCERLHLDPRKKIEELSLGNRKKAAIICALQHNPQLCILDEPTSGLDPLMQREFFSILREKNQQGMTVFLSSHILSEIQRYCSGAAIIRQGKIIASGKIEDLAKTKAKRITIHGSFSPKNLPGIRDFHTAEEESSFLYSGDIHLLLKELSASPIKDLSISEPELDEIFLHYYTEGGASL